MTSYTLLLPLTGSSKVKGNAAFVIIMKKLLLTYKHRLLESLSVIFNSGSVHNSQRVW